MSFLLFQKIKNNNPAQVAPIIVRADSIFLYSDDALQNRVANTNYTATRVELSSFPNYNFYTTSLLNSVSSVLNVIDVTGGAGTSGSSCAGSPGILDTVYVSTTYPMIKANMLVNQSKDQLYPYVFNPEYLVFAETVTYLDKGTGVEDVALLLVLRDAQPRRILTDLAFDDLVTILDPAVVPTP